jgi:hypothetical protein
MNTYTAIVPAPVAPFAGTILRAFAVIPSMSREDIEHALCSRVFPNSFSLYADSEYQTCWLDAEANDLSVAQEDAKYHGNDDEFIRLGDILNSRVEQTDYEIRQLLIHALRVHDVAEFKAAIIAKRLGVMANHVEEEECPFQRMERRVEMAMESRLAGTPIDWDVW